MNVLQYICLDSTDSLSRNRSLRCVLTYTYEIQLTVRNDNHGTRYARVRRSYGAISTMFKGK